MQTQPKPKPKAADTKPAEPQVWINGKVVPKSQAVVSVYDHGLLYGDGVFEGIRVSSGKVFRLEEHIDRLFDSAKHIWLEVPYTREQVIDATNETVRVNAK